MKIKSCGVTDVGLKREKNEDSILVDDDASIYIVADGMGGHLGGEFASRLAVETVRDIFHKFREDPETTQTEFSEEVIRDIGARLKYAISKASNRVYEEAGRNVNLAGMGTTMVGLVIDDGKAYIGHVGDSRAYLLQDNEIIQLTEDHSLVAEQIRAGFITEEGAKYHRLKNIITRSVGFQKDVEADILVRDLEDGDTFLLCSDGLSNMLEDESLLSLVRKSKNLQTACKRLVDEANKSGGEDNISVILVKIGNPS